MQHEYENNYPGNDDFFYKANDKEVKGINNSEFHYDTNVIENFYTDYQCSSPSNLTKLKKWKTSFGTKAGIAIATTIQLAPAIKNGAVAAWPRSTETLGKACTRLFNRSNKILKVCAKPLLIIGGLVAIAGLGYLGFNYFMDTVLPAVQEAMKPSAWQSEQSRRLEQITSTVPAWPDVMDILSFISYLTGIGFGIKGAFQMKMHNQDDRQMPLSVPVTYMAISALLVVLPSFISIGATTTVGSGPETIVQSQQKTQNVKPINIAPLKAASGTY